MRSGAKLNVHDLSLILLFIFVVIFILLYISTGSLLQALVMGIFGASAPILFMKMKNAKTQALIENQLPGAIEYIARSLNAGHSLNAAIQAAVIDSPMPIAAQLKITCDQLNIGMPIRDVMHNLIYRIDTEDVRFFSIAIVINQETGGSLASLLGEVSGMMRARLESKVLVKTLASEGKIAAKVLGLLPLILVIMVSMMHPNYYDALLKHPIGMNIIYYTIGLVLVGFFWMRQITDIRV
jgi:tight adherence protein B